MPLSFRTPAPRPRANAALLRVEKLDVYYGRAHALQQVSLELDQGVLAVVGRNGMGKTTLCNAITGLVRATGSVRLAGEEILGLPPYLVTRRGIGYVPQGRRVWPSLSVDEHLRLAHGASAGRWTPARIYELFPPLAERRHHGGAQLSGGEQQMLAIARALLLNPRLLVMDEPTEGLAPVIVEQLTETLKSLSGDGEISVLLVEQSLGVAIDVADRVAVMVNGRIARNMSAAELGANRELQLQLLGARASEEYETDGEADVPFAAAEDEGEIRVYTIKRGSEAPVAAAPPQPRTLRGFTRWNAADPEAPLADRPLERPGPRDTLVENRAAADAALPSLDVASRSLAERGRDARALEFPVATSAMRAAYIAGTFDTKGRELFYLRDCLEKLGLRTVTVDLATSGKPSPATVHPREVARHHPKGEHAVFTGDRGSSISEMAAAFAEFIVRRRDLGGLVSAGGSGGTALATEGMRRLPIGVPKVMVSTVASGDVKPYVGPSDICMMYSVTDVSGINRISERVLANGAHALAGMIAHGRSERRVETKPAVALTMFGVTTPCVQAVAKALEEHYDCLVFHATGTGGQSMEKLVASGLLAGVLDLTTTEIADELVGGVLSAGRERLDAMIAARLPYVGSCGALDMVNFWAMDTVPAQFRGRKLHMHNQNVTLMRTTPEECAAIGRFIAAKLNRMEGPMRFLIPEGGVSLLDTPGQPFWDPAADKALFDSITGDFRAGSNRKLIHLPVNINDPAFAEAAVAAFAEVVEPRAAAGRQRRP